MEIKLIGDGRFILTAVTDWTASHYSLIRVYDVNSMNVLFEYEVSHDELDLEADERITEISFMSIDEGYYAIVFEGNFFEGYTFLFDMRRIHSIFIAINELEE